MRFVFIAGCQRSGTTLMRLILELQSAIACLDEERGYRLLPRLRDESTLESLKSLGRPWVGFKIPGFTEQLTAMQIRGPDYGEFPNFYRNGPIVFLVRDVRDVVTSMERLRYPDGENWLRRYGVPIQTFKMNEPEFTKRYAREIGFVERSEFSNEAVGAQYWKYKTEVLFDYLDAGCLVNGVIYEDVVSDPRSVLSELTKSLGLPWEEDLLNHPRKAHGQVDANGKVIGGTDVKQAIHDQSIGRYYDHLAPGQLDRISEIVGDVPDRLTKRIRA